MKLIVCLKKSIFSVLWQQRQNFLWGLISQLFVYGSFTLMAHFEAYISHMDMENYNETHSLTKKLARTFQTSLIEIYGNKILPKSCIFRHINTLFSNNPIIYPPSVIHYWKGMTMRINKTKGMKL